MILRKSLLNSLLPFNRIILNKTIPTASTKCISKLKTKTFHYPGDVRCLCLRTLSKHCLDWVPYNFKWSKVKQSKAYIQNEHTVCTQPHNLYAWSFYNFISVYTASSHTHIYSYPWTSSWRRLVIYKLTRHTNQIIDGKRDRI